MNRRIVPGIALVTAVLAAGCAARKSYLTTEDFRERAGSLKKIGVVVAEARIFNLQDDGGATLDPEASERCAAGTAAAAKQTLGARGYEVIPVPLDDDGRALLADYLKIREDIFTAFSSNKETIRDIPPFASAPAVCAKNGVDGIVFVGARDHVTPGGRKVRFWDMAVFRISSGKGMAYADLSVIDRTGKLIFYDQKSGSNYALTGDEDLSTIFAELASGLPPAGGK